MAAPLSDDLRRRVADAVGGMLNVSVANTRTDSIGIAHAMQVGMSQAVNIGLTKMETVGQAKTLTIGEHYIINVGKQMQINVGEVLQIVVGQSTLTTDKDGNVTITGTKEARRVLRLCDGVRQGRRPQSHQVKGGPMLIRNDTPFAAMSFGDLHRDGMTMAVICVRASYNVSIAGAPQLGNHQEVALNDIYEGDPHRTPMVRVGDLIPYKPAAPAASRTTRRSHDLAFWNPRGSETRLRRSSP